MAVFPIANRKVEWGLVLFFFLRATCDQNNDRQTWLQKDCGGWHKRVMLKQSDGHDVMEKKEKFSNCHTDRNERRVWLLEEKKRVSSITR